jgi:glycosyltransferase involved in cell wall biosynthesis
MKISACMIAKNESENIEKSLANLKKIANEMIVVDTGSTDDTKKIARKLGALVYDYKWQDDFAAAKNYAIKKAAGDWIIFLDADEYFAEESLELVKQAIATAAENVDAIGAKMLNIDIDRNNFVKNSFAVVRIFRNSGQIFYVEKVHEHLHKQNGAPCIAHLPQEIIIYHTGYSSGRIRRKLERNLKLLLKEKAEDIQPIHYRYLCDCYHGLAEWEKAYAAGKKYIAEKGKASDMDSMTYLKILFSLRQFCDSNETITAEFETALKLFPEKPEIYMQYGDFSYIKLKEYDSALYLYETAAELNKRPHDFKAADDYQGYADWCYVKIADIYLMKRFYDKALEYNAAALKKTCRLLKNVDAAAKIALLKRFYDVQNISDMKFLQENISAIGIGRTYSYFQKYFPKEMQNNDLAQLVKNLLAAKNWQSLRKVCRKRLAEINAALAKNNK